MMLNFAEQTGSGAVIIVWSILMMKASHYYITSPLTFSFIFLQLAITEFSIAAHIHDK